MDPDGATAESTERTDLTPIVPSDFTVPLELTTDRTVLRPLGPEHNEADHHAWTSNIAHIRSTPGFAPPRQWPEAGMTLERNLGDLIAHHQHFQDRVGFTYTVLDRNDEDVVLGCVYIYEDTTGEAEVDVRSWTVTPELDREVWLAVSNWLTDDWPFASVRYEAR